MFGSRRYSDFVRRCSSHQCRRSKARDSRVTYSVSIVTFVAELGRPPMCLVFSKSHNIIRRFPSRHFVIESAGLTVPEIFSILSSRFFSLCCTQKTSSQRVGQAAPGAESQPACCCSICPDSYVSLVSQLSYRVGQLDGLTRTAYHVVVLKFRAPQCHHFLCRRPSCQGVFDQHASVDVTCRVAFHVNRTPSHKA